MDTLFQIDLTPADLLTYMIRSSIIAIILYLFRRYTHSYSNYRKSIDDVESYINKIKNLINRNNNVLNLWENRDMIEENLKLLKGMKESLSNFRAGGS